MKNLREEYDKRKIRYFWKDNCPFCTNLKENNEILFENNFWIVVKNKYPYFNCSKWLLAFPKKHKELTSELENEELISFVEVEKFMKNFYWENDYFSFIRQTKSNKSVEHMHYHYILGNISAENINGKNYFKIKK